MSTILITGGTGLVGTALRHLLTENGYHVIILSRNPPPNDPTAAHWDPATGSIDTEAIRHVVMISTTRVWRSRSWQSKNQKKSRENN